MKIGAQLYTTRELCKTLDGLDQTLARVSDIGYTTVQLSGICAYEAEWMAEKLKKYGLSADITHFDYNRITKDTENTIKFHDIMGCKYIGIGSNPRGATPEGLDLMESEIRPAVELMIKSGHKFTYHNHNMEFARFGGKTFLELLCERFTPDQCNITFDTYWAVAGGADPVEWLKILSGRVGCIHMKDMVFSPEDKAVRMACVGQGNMNYRSILYAAEEAGTEFAYVEQDNCYGEDPIACLKRSYEWLNAEGLK